jgi:hypothetical protein
MGGNAVSRYAQLPVPVISAVLLTMLSFDWQSSFNLAILRACPVAAECPLSTKVRLAMKGMPATLPISPLFSKKEYSDIIP